MKQIAHFIATCGPLGSSRFAPGTLGSLVGIPFILILGNHLSLFTFSLFVLFFIAVWSSHVVAQNLAEHDPPNVVIDETCGMMVSLLLLPIRWETLLVGFVGFRFFDIVKPPPIRFLEHLPWGFGIVLDDIAAGIYTNLLLQILVRYAHL